MDHLNDLNLDLWGDDEDETYNEEIEYDVPEVPDEIFVKY
jgi:hypothetical protein